MRLPRIFRRNRKRARSIASVLASADPLGELLRGVADDSLEQGVAETEIEEILSVLKTSLPTTPLARECLDRILVSGCVRIYMERLFDIGVLQYLFPDVTACVGIPHRGRGIRDVFEHLLETCRLIVPDRCMRLAALLHDVGKADTLGLKKGRITFHGHQVVGADKASRALTRLGYSSQLASRVSALIKHHMFQYSTQTGATPIRRLVDRLGPDMVRDLLELRRADIVGSGGDCTHAWPVLKSLADELKQIAREDSNDGESG